MLNLQNIDLTPKKTTEEEVKGVKSYIYQLYNELSFRLGFDIGDYDKRISANESKLSSDKLTITDSDWTFLTEWFNDQPHGGEYAGPYTVTPMVNSQVVLETDTMTMNDDVTVHRVPQYEVENPSGGNTLTIGDDITIE